MFTLRMWSLRTRWSQVEKPGTLTNLLHFRSWKKRNRSTPRRFAFWCSSHLRIISFSLFLIFGWTPNRRVHISEKTMSFLHGEFEVEPAFGEKREEALRIAGLKTFFITKVLKPVSIACLWLINWCARPFNNSNETLISEEILCFSFYDGKRRKIGSSFYWCLLSFDSLSNPLFLSCVCFRFISLIKSFCAKVNMNVITKHLHRSVSLCCEKQLSNELICLDACFWSGE